MPPRVGTALTEEGVAGGFGAVAPAMPGVRASPAIESPPRAMAVRAFRGENREGTEYFIQQHLPLSIHWHVAGAVTARNCGAMFCKSPLARDSLLAGAKNVLRSSHASTLQAVHRLAALAIAVGRSSSAGMPLNEDVVLNVSPHQHQQIW